MIYKKLENMMKNLKNEDVENINELNRKLDDIYNNFYQSEEQVLKMQKGEDRIIKLVQDHSKWMSGEGFETEATSRISKMKTSTSSILWMKILKGKVLPWLRKKLQDKGSRVSQLMDF